MGDKNTFFLLLPGEVVCQLLTEEITGSQGAGGGRGGGGKRHTLSFCSRLKDLGEVVLSFLKKLTFKRAK